MKRREFRIMVSVTRRHLVLAIVTGLLVGGMSLSAQAGLICSVSGDGQSFDQLATHSSLPFSLVLDLCLNDDPGPGMVVPDVSDDGSNQPTQPVMPLFVLFNADLVVGMQAASQSGMSGVSSTIGPQSNSASFSAVLSADLELADPPLRDRLLDEPRLVLPLGPPFELLRPA